MTKYTFETVVDKRYRVKGTKHVTVEAHSIVAARMEASNLLDELARKLGSPLPPRGWALQRLEGMPK